MLRTTSKSRYLLICFVLSCSIRRHEAMLYVMQLGVYEFVPAWLCKQVNQHIGQQHVSYASSCLSGAYLCNCLLYLAV